MERPRKRSEDGRRGGRRQRGLVRETDPRHALAYSPLWDAQLGLLTDKAVQQGLNKRQIDEVQVFNLAATRPDLLTGVNPATGQPAPYGASGVDINCAVIGFTAKAPTANDQLASLRAALRPPRQACRGRGAVGESPVELASAAEAEPGLAGSPVGLPATASGSTSAPGS